ncbi:hypothetical protein [Pseudomonas syringae]|uniref:hypothetical protein n=1 Tax=Pseudomonas syringae TaxID=317 RepID=UPI003F77790D
MTENLTEEEMRQALFGLSAPTISEQPKSSPKPLSHASPKPVQRKYSAPRLRVTLKVAKVYDGDEELFTYDANTLSSLVAEQEARSAAKKKRFKYFELVSVVTV